MLQEWYTPEPDYNLPDQGSPSFKDFDYNAVIFPQPTDQLKTYHDELNLRFGGIRKPRLGNSGLLTMYSGIFMIPVVVGGLNCTSELITCGAPVLKLESQHA